MSSAGNDDRGTDYWIARTDRSELARLTRFGPSAEGDPQVAADASFGPDGTRFVAYVQSRVAGSTGTIYMIEDVFGSAEAHAVDRR
jgi:hypothetical protein